MNSVCRDDLGVITTLIPQNREYVEPELRIQFFQFSGDLIIYRTRFHLNRVRTPDPDNARGGFFIRFISLMMMVYIRRSLRAYSESLPISKRKDDKVHGMTVRELMRSLNSVMAVGNTGNWRLAHITKTNRQIFSAFGLDEIFTGKIMNRTDFTCNIKHKSD